MGQGHQRHDLELLRLSWWTGLTRKYSVHDTKEIYWIWALLAEIVCPLTTPTILYNDNQFHSRTKHIDIHFHFIREAAENRTLTLMYCPMDDMVVDIFTQALPLVKIIKLSKLLRLTAGWGGVLEGQCNRSPTKQEFNELWQNMTERYRNMKKVLWTFVMDIPVRVSCFIFFYPINKGIKQQSLSSYVSVKHSTEAYVSRITLFSYYI